MPGDMTTYHRLRSLGVSIEGADAMVPHLDAMTARDREAHILHAQGMRYREIAARIGASKSTVGRIVRGNA